MPTVLNAEKNIFEKNIVHKNFVYKIIRKIFSTKFIGNIVGKKFKIHVNAQFRGKFLWNS